VVHGGFSRRKRQEQGEQQTGDVFHGAS
jgi:hypothetical protein